MNNEELYELQADPGEQTNVIADHPEIVAELRAAYDQWWDEVQPMFVNEVPTDFNHFSFRELYTKQFGKEATTAAMKKKDSKKAKINAKAETRAELLKRRADRKKQRAE